MKRPEHPDFWLISQALLDQDALSGTEEIDDTLARMIDPESVAYAAIQRAMRARGQGSGLEVMLPAIWLDGFYAGMQVQQLKNKQNPDVSDDPA